MGVQVVHDQHDALGVGIVHVDQLLNEVRPILLGAPLGDLSLTPTAQRLAGDEDIARAVPLVVVIDALGLARLHWQGRADMGSQLLR